MASNSFTLTQIFFLFAANSVPVASHSRFYALVAIHFLHVSSRLIFKSNFVFWLSCEIFLLNLSGDANVLIVFWLCYILSFLLKEDKKMVNFDGCVRCLLSMTTSDLSIPTRIVRIRLCPRQLETVACRRRGVGASPSESRYLYGCSCCSPKVRSSIHFYFWSVGVKHLHTCSCGLAILRKVDGNVGSYFFLFIT